MDDLIIDITVDSKREKNPCVETQPVSISISYQIDVNKEQFQAIQDAAMKQMLGGFGNIMKPLMPLLFNPATFFDVYYGDYYQTWIDQLNAM